MDNKEMEKKELNLEELDQVSGGAFSSRGAWFCPMCSFSCNVNDRNTINKHLETHDNED